MFVHGSLANVKAFRFDERNKRVVAIFSRRRLFEMCTKRARISLKYLFYLKASSLSGRKKKTPREGRRTAASFIPHQERPSFLKDIQEREEAKRPQSNSRHLGRGADKERRRRGGVGGRRGWHERGRKRESDRDKGGLLRKPIRASRQSLLPRATWWHTQSLSLSFLLPLSLSLRFHPSIRQRRHIKIA